MVAYAVAYKIAYTAGYIKLHLIFCEFFEEMGDNFLRKPEATSTTAMTTTKTFS